MLQVLFTWIEYQVVCISMSLVVLLYGKTNATLFCNFVTMIWEGFLGALQCHIRSWWHIQYNTLCMMVIHNDVVKWKHFPHNWPFVWGIHWSPVNSPYKGQCYRDLLLSLIYTWTSIVYWVNNWDTSGLRCHRTQYDITVMREHLLPGVGDTICWKNVLIFLWPWYQFCVDPPAHIL